VGAAILLVSLALLAAGCVLAAPILRPVVGAVALAAGLLEGGALAAGGRYKLGETMIALCTLSIGAALLAG